MSLTRRLALTLALTVPLPALAQEFPTRPVTLVVPFAPGGSTDIIARIISDKMGRSLGQSVIIENRAGAGGNVGANAVSKAAPDGYTILMGTISTHALNSAFYKTMPYNPVNDFEHVSFLVNMPLVLITSKSSGIKTVAELIAKAKAAPNTLSFASSGNGTPLHVSGELFNTMTGVKLQHLPYRGGGPAMNDLVAGHVPVMFDNLPSAIEQIRGGTVTALAVTTKERSPETPTIPTLHELGLKDFDTYSWTAIFAPKGTPKPILDKLYKASIEAVLDPETRKRLEASSAVIVAKDGVALKAHVQQQLDLWVPIAKASGVSAD